MIIYNEIVMIVKNREAVLDEIKEHLRLLNDIIEVYKVIDNFIKDLIMHNHLIKSVIF